MVTKLKNSYSFADTVECSDYFHCENELSSNPNSCDDISFKRLCPVSCKCEKCNLNGCEIGKKYYNLHFYHDKREKS